MTRCEPSRQRGFTYLWVLLLVAFMGVGLTVAVELDATVARRDRERELLAIGRQFQTAIGRYYEGQGAGAVKEYPATLDDLLQDRRVPGIRRHLRKVFVDPMTATTEWGLVTVGGRVVGVHSLATGTPIKQDNFAPEQMNLRGKQTYEQWLFVYPPDLVLDAPPGVVPAPAAPLVNPVPPQATP
jgi:type II secretory pathway pseudopilin PulG